MDGSKKRTRPRKEISDKSQRQSNSRKRKFHSVVVDNVSGTADISEGGPTEMAPGKFEKKGSPKEDVGMLRPRSAEKSRSMNPEESSSRQCSSSRVKATVRLPSLGLTGRRGITKTSVFAPVVDASLEKNSDRRPDGETPTEISDTLKTEDNEQKRHQKRFRLGLRPPQVSSETKPKYSQHFVKLKNAIDDPSPSSNASALSDQPVPSVSSFTEECIPKHLPQKEPPDESEESPDEIALSPIASRPMFSRRSMQSRLKRYRQQRNSDDDSSRDMFSDGDDSFANSNSVLETDENYAHGSMSQTVGDLEGSGVKSFYGFQTFLNQTENPSPPSQSHHFDFGPAEKFKTCSAGTTVCFESVRPCPSREEVFESMKTYGLFEMREKEELRHGVFMSIKDDLGGIKSKNVDVGKERLKLAWERDLPPFESRFRPITSTNKTRDLSLSKGNITYACVSDPPTYHEVEKTLSFIEKPHAENKPSDLPKLHRVGLRQNSENDSEESELSMSASDRSHDSVDDSEFSQSQQALEKSDASLCRKRLEYRREMRKSSSRIISSDNSINNPQGFKTNFKNLKSSKGVIAPQYLKLLSMEVHVVTRCRFLPDPEYDPLAAIFFVFSSDEGCKNICKKTGLSTKNGYCLIEGIFVVTNEFEQETHSPENHLLSKTGISEHNVTYFNDEKELMIKFADLVVAEDPDILLGYEVQQSSWSFLVKRASVKYDLNYPPLISRCPSNEHESKIISSEKSANFITDPDTELHIVGRIVLNVWRLMRSEVTLTSYTAENLFYHVLHERIPKYDHQTLTQWWTSPKAGLTRWKVVDYYLVRAHGNLRLLDQLDFVGRTSELAKLFGIQFFEVLSRGSQFRVESIMLRLVKARNFIPVSPSIQQRAKMRAPEYLPLVMEPESRFYSDPVIVLDFQSLYPSIIMAYNYCYSTCIGRIVNQMEEMLSREDCSSKTTLKFGCTQLMISLDRLAKLEGHLNFSPGGIAFLKSSVRRGILPKMLEEILDTRQMVKRSMKLYNQEAKRNRDIEIENDALQKILHSRQLGLKLIANVTYGYTSANFSGRMPCIEVGDSVVSKGRETLERAIHFIETASCLDGRSGSSLDQGSQSSGKVFKSWEGARVVYGDTDSLFVLLPGRTKEEAFTIGQEMADEITKLNPKPVKLKFEKVYHPCILQTKKRYVGYMYETPDQVKPVYEAKGIETVRRDGVPSIVKILEKSLRILFESKDVSLVKRYVQRQFSKISSGKIPMQDLTFAREFRGMAGYRPTACVPALELAKRLSRVDRMCVPPQSYRVPYVIIFGEPGRPLFHSVRAPHEVLEAQYPKLDGVGILRPNTHYYITKVIVPALDRCLSLIGADVMKWYVELPKIQPRSLLVMDGANSVVTTHSVSFHGHQSEFQTRGRPRQNRIQTGDQQGRQGVILQYFSSCQCIICDKVFPEARRKLDNKVEMGRGQICSNCLDQPQRTVLKLNKKLKTWDKTYDQLSRLCSSCAGGSSHPYCVSYDCPLLYQRTLAEAEAQQVPVVTLILDSLSIF